jgi:hypothetical protein
MDSSPYFFAVSITRGELPAKIAFNHLQHHCLNFPSRCFVVALASWLPPAPLLADCAHNALTVQLDGRTGSSKHDGAIGDHGAAARTQSSHIAIDIQPVVEFSWMNKFQFDTMSARQQRQGFTLAV